MRELNLRNRRPAAWVALAVVGTLLAAAPSAHAARKLARRTLPAAASSEAPALQAAADPALAAAVDRLRGALEQPGPTVARQQGLPGAPADGAYLGRSPRGHATAFVAPAGRPYRVARPAGAGPEGVALGFLREHKVAFGWSKKGVSLPVERAVVRGERTFVRFEQRFAGLPVFGAGALVQVEKDGGVAFALVDVSRDDAEMHAEGFETAPATGPGSAVTAALGTVPPGAPGVSADEPVLMVYEPSVIGNAGPTRLVWHVRARNPEGDVNQVVLVDASSGDVALSYSDVKHAKNRQIYDANNVPGSLGTLVRSEGGAATGVSDVDLAYQYFGDTYDFYFTRFGRDSYDGAGAILLARVRYCEATGSCPYINAYWNGSEMRFGQGFAAADDVVAHELTHAVTERESNLIYYAESGAINEALSDIFGEFVDLSNTGGTDTSGVRWQMGEDAPGGAIRSMADPTLNGDPDRRYSANWYTGSDDNRGVHINSGVANKLAYLLTDGGSFNGQTVAAQGITNVAKLFYEANVNLLLPASDYFDLYAVLRQAAINVSLTPAFREALEKASRAVQIDLPSNPTTVFSDTFEGAFPGSWQVFDQGGAAGTGLGTRWGKSTHRKAGGTASAWCAAGGASPSPAGGNYKSYMDTWLVYGPFTLANTSNAWAEFDIFMDVEYPFDEAFWGVSVDGVNFDGFAVSPGPDGYTVGQSTIPGFAHEVFSFREITGTIGQSQVWFAVQFVSDVEQEYEGVYLDNVVIKKSPTQAPFGNFDTPTTGATGVTGAIPVTGWALDDQQVTSVKIHRNPLAGEPTQPNGKVYIGDATFVPGARPDVDAANPTYPFSYKAGWGYMLLTNFLPNGGNGTTTLYAYANDAEGQSTLLGQKTITCSNATATKPFGTIDTPTQGGTVSGTINNFGWALTPGTALIPFDGSTITVYVDGVPIGNPTAYGLARADIDSLFPGYTNTGHAVGYRVIDTTALANGLHTLSWVVTDNQGRADGIGSRYFWVQN
jgi:Zn-dependent metalloprotease